MFIPPNNSNCPEIVGLCHPVMGNVERLKREEEVWEVRNHDNDTLPVTGNVSFMMLNTRWADDPIMDRDPTNYN